jgi:hypothetical protein
MHSTEELTFNPDGTGLKVLKLYYACFLSDPKCNPDFSKEFKYKIGVFADLEIDGEPWRYRLIDGETLDLEGKIYKRLK